MKEIRNRVQIKWRNGKANFNRSREQRNEGFRNDSLSIIGAFIWEEIRKGAQINRGMGKLISIIRGSREMKGLEMIL